MVETDRSGVIGFQTEVSEGDAGLHGIRIEGRRIKWQRPMCFCWRHALGMAIVQDGVIKMSWNASLVVSVQGGHEGVYVQTKFLRQLWQRLSDGTFKYGRHKTTHCFGI